MAREPRRGLWSWSAIKQLTFMLEARWEDRGKSIGSSGIVRDTFAREVYEPATNSFKTTFTAPVYVRVQTLLFLPPWAPFSLGKNATCGNRYQGPQLRASAIETSLTRFRGNLHLTARLLCQLSWNVDLRVC